MIKFDLTNRVAIVTGGAQGFGLAITERFVEAGAKVVIWDIDEDAVKKALEKINSDNLSYQIVDVSNFENINKNLTETEITIYKSTIVIIGEEEGLFAARQAIEMLAGGAEHGSVLNYLEKDRRRAKLSNRSLESIELRQSDSTTIGFENLVPGLSEVSNRRSRKMKASQVDPKDAQAVEEMMQLSKDEEINWEEEFGDAWWELAYSQGWTDEWYWVDEENGIGDYYWYDENGDLMLDTECSIITDPLAEGAYEFGLIVRDA